MRPNGGEAELAKLAKLLERLIEELVRAALVPCREDDQRRNREGVQEQLRIPGRTRRLDGAVSVALGLCKLVTTETDQCADAVCARGLVMRSVSDL